MIVSHFAFLAYVFFAFCCLVGLGLCVLRLTAWTEIDLGDMMFLCWLLELSSLVGAFAWWSPANGFTMVVQ